MAQADIQKELLKNSRYSNPLKVTFGKDRRKLMGDMVREHSNSPGPGNYTLPSDFGYTVEKKFLNKLMQKIKRNSMNSTQQKMFVE